MIKSPSNYKDKIVIMPLSKSAKKALRKDRRRTVVNNRIRSHVRNIIKQVRETKDSALLPKLYSVIDTAAKKDIMHVGKAKRIKSRLNKLTKNASSKSK